MQVTFTKMHGIGNDYIYFDCILNPDLIPNPKAVAPFLSDRHCGVGGDGIVLILRDQEADFCMRMFNADGSEAEMCGNAIRCVAKYLCDNNYLTSDNVAIQTGAGIKTVQIMRDAFGDFRAARVDMGAPELEPQKIPVTTIDPVIVTKDKTPYRFSCVSMGNPHAVTFVDEITDKQVLEHGPEIEVDPHFPNKTNVEFVKVINENEVEMRVWERGSGETMACGTGASAVAVAAVKNNLTKRKVTVHLRGGDLEIEWGSDNHVYMTGPATTVFVGTVTLPENG